MSTRTLTLTASISPVTHCRLDAFLRQQTDLHNAALEERIDCYRKTGEAITYNDQQKALTEIRVDDESFSRFPVEAQRTALRRVDQAMKMFFKRVKEGKKPGFPRFKGKGRRARSFDVPRPRIRNDSLHVKGVGRFKLSGRLPERSTVTLARVVKTPVRVTVHLVAEVEDRPRPPGAPVGIDVGVRERAVLSTGETVPAVSLDRRKIKRLQRLHARARKRSNARAKKARSLAREWARVNVRERNALHRITSDIASRHNRIAVEDLEITSMVKLPSLARSIHEQQWGRFVQMLTYKAESAGGEVIRVDYRNTSTGCSVCGHRQKMPLRARTYRCGGCGAVMDRDLNAARNILSRGVSAAGWDVSAHAERGPGASESVDVLPHVTALVGQGAERCTAACA